MTSWASAARPWDVSSIWVFWSSWMAPIWVSMPVLRPITVFSTTRDAATICAALATRGSCGAGVSGNDVRRELHHEVDVDGLAGARDQVVVRQLAGRDSIPAERVVRKIEVEHLLDGAASLDVGQRNLDLHARRRRRESGG